jgi:hypothetical protein
MQRESAKSQGEERGNPHTQTQDPSPNLPILSAMVWGSVLDHWADEAQEVSGINIRCKPCVYTKGPNHITQHRRPYNF